jgi:glucose-6-phosphate 1-dehydrogenase
MTEDSYQRDAAMAENASTADTKALHLYLPPPEPFAMILFGATGDLAARKLYPSLFGLWQAELLPEKWAIIGTGRKPIGDDGFRDTVAKSLQTFRAGATKEQVVEFVKHVYYQPVDAKTTEGFGALKARIDTLNSQLDLSDNRLTYLAIEPDLFATIIDHCAQVGLTKTDGQAWARVVIEKPFGHDLTSARLLDADIRTHLRSDQIFRIDHYLGKDTVQNIAALRFGNAIFEPIFNRHYVDHVQITMAETIGMEGHRGSYYNQAGALRDVMQNHMLQLLALAAMEPPATLRANDIANAKMQTLHTLVPIRHEDVGKKVVRGQYTAGTIDGKPVPGYRQEKEINPQSFTETFVAMRVEIDNWRWAGVPFFLRSGKRLAKRVTEIAVQFKLPPLSLFRTVECEGDVCDLTAARPNVLIMRIQPNEGVSLSFSTKRPGMWLDLSPAKLDFYYQQTFNHPMPEAYERLIFDALRGDHTLFMRSDELEMAWHFVTPILREWEREDEKDLAKYSAGTWGPAEADRLMAGNNGGWRKA